VPQSTNSGCADVKEFETTNSKISTKQEDESSPHPPYSPDVAPSDFHRFGHLNDALRGSRFADDLLEHYVCEELRRFSKKFYATVLRQGGKGVLIMKETVKK
jgi:hypothetical protein